MVINFIYAEMDHIDHKVRAANIYKEGYKEGYKGMTIGAPHVARTATYGTGVGSRWSLTANRIIGSMQRKKRSLRAVSPPFYTKGREIDAL